MKKNKLHLIYAKEARKAIESDREELAGITGTILVWALIAGIPLLSVLFIGWISRR